MQGQLDIVGIISKKYKFPISTWGPRFSVMSYLANILDTVAWLHFIICQGYSALDVKKFYQDIAHLIPDLEDFQNQNQNQNGSSSRFWFLLLALQEEIYNLGFIEGLKQWLWEKWDWPTGLKS